MAVGMREIMPEGDFDLLEVFFFISRGNNWHVRLTWSFPSETAGVITMGTRTTRILPSVITIGTRTTRTLRIDADFAERDGLSDNDLNGRGNHGRQVRVDPQSPRCPRSHCYHAALSRSANPRRSAKSALSAFQLSSRRAITFGKIRVDPQSPRSNCCHNG